MGTGLAAAIDEVLAVDPADLTDDELHHLVVSTQRHTHRLAAARAALISAWDSRHCWAADGSRSAGHRLAREASMSVRAAKCEVRRAKALRSMPNTATALTDGALSPEHVDLLAGANSGNRRTLFEPHEEMLVDQCKQLRFADAYRMIEYWKQRADADATEHDAQDQHDGRGATAATTLDGMVDLRALLDPIGGAAFLNELVRIMEQLRLQDLAHGVNRSTTQRRADALVEMANRSRTARDGGLRPRPLITIHVGEESFARICELAAGTVIAPGQVVPYLYDADLERIVFDGPDRVMSVSHKRCFTGALRRAIEVRDRHCQHPSGCDEPADRCDVDHIIPHSQGGLTSQDNGRLHCRPHNRNNELRNARPPDPPAAEPADPDEVATADPDPPSEPEDRAPPDAA